MQFFHCDCQKLQIWNSFALNMWMYKLIVLTSEQVLSVEQCFYLEYLCSNFVIYVYYMHVQFHVFLQFGLLFYPVVW